MSKTRVVVYTQKPDGFASNVDAVGCLVEVQGEILILQRQKGKPEEDTWGPPAGKLEQNESLPKGAARELSEETGLKHVHKNQLVPQGTFYAHYPDLNKSITFHVYSLELPVKFNVQINPTEHQNFTWATPDEALAMDLMGGFADVLKFCYFRR